ncbi:MAG: alpha/beta hydrolase fold domain-containing protein [Chthoniobacterales bacterium]|jgi:acetyl esterase/lipase
MKKFRLPAHVALLFALASAGVAGAVPQPDTRWTYKTVDGRDLVLDVFLPAGYAESQDTFPAMVYFHGGSWREGNPSAQYPDCAYWAARGMVAASAHYRLKDRDRVEVPRACLEDAQAAVRYLRANAQKLKINPDKIVAAGDSAGGMLAAATAMIDGGEKDAASCVPSAVILHCPYWKTGVPPDLMPPAAVRRGLPPFIIFLGDQDQAVKVGEILDFHEKLRAAGNDSETYIGFGGRHGFANGGNPNNKFFHWAVGLQDTFLVRHGIINEGPKPPAPAGVPALEEGKDYAAHRTPSLADSLPALPEGRAPRTFDELWAGYDPRREPLDIEVLHQREKDGVVLQVVRFRVGVFKGKKAMMAAVYGYPKDGKNLPGLVQIHGGGQSASENAVLTNAKRGYATLSLAWAGRIAAGPYTVNHGGVKLFHDGKTDDPNYRVTTDWGAIDAYHDPCRDKETRYGSTSPGPSNLDAVDSPRNSPWFFYALAGRRALTFLEQQPAVDGSRLGVYGHSMGGQQTVALAGTDSRVKAAAPSCGGITYRIRENPAAQASISDAANLARITCPVVFLMPANDFNGRAEDLAPAIALLKNPDWRIVRAPHHDHQDTAEYEVATQLFFDDHLKGTFDFPATPEIAVQWPTPEGIPVATARPDPTREPLSVDFYYTQNAIPREDLDAARKPRMAYYWRHAAAEKSGDTWTAKLPMSGDDRPVWVFANVTYRLDPPVTGAGYYYRDYTADHFVVSSPMVTAEARELQAAGVKAAFQPTTLIESFANPLDQDWFTYKPEHWGRSTRRINDPQWSAPEGAKLGLAVLATDPLELEITLGEGKAVKKIPAGTQWQELVFEPADFKNKQGQGLADFRNLNFLGIGEGPGRPSPSTPKFRNLRWIAP